MRVLVVGSGGREHALVWAISRSKRVDAVFAAPGNGGTSASAQNVDIGAEDIDALLTFASDERIELTVVGPEAPLVAGIVDRFRDAGHRCFGPSGKAARLEGSKVFAKEFMLRHGIPTADFGVFYDAATAGDRVGDMHLPVVVKADGLAGGKGVIVAQTDDEAQAAIQSIMVEGKFGASGSRVVIEEYLEGQEVSVHAVCAGGRATLFPSSQDHKRIFDDDGGPNTGGMGAYAPVPFINDEFMKGVYSTIIEPTLRGMEFEGCPFTGVLYAGLMVTEEGPKVLEFNVRFGDPETQALLPTLKTDLAELLFESAEGNLPSKIEYHSDRCVASVVVASKGYPGSYKAGFRIEGLDRVNDARRVAFHAGTKRQDRGFVTSGGRVVAVSAWAKDLAPAIRHAYEGVDMVRFEGAYCRRDIGAKAI